MRGVTFSADAKFADGDSKRMTLNFERGGCFDRCDAAVAGEVFKCLSEEVTVALLMIKLGLTILVRL